MKTTKNPVLNISHQVRIRSIRGNVAVIEEHINLGPDELMMMAKHVTKEPVLHEIYVIGGDAKGSHFKEEFIEIPEGTKIIVNVDLKLKCVKKFFDMFRKTRYEKNYAEIIETLLKVADK